MILTIETALQGIATMLRDRIAPTIDDKFAGETARLAQLLLTLNAGWVDDAAAVRVAENRQIRALFADAVPVITDVELAMRIADAAASSDPGLRIGELDHENNRLRILLGELHVSVDDAEAASAREISQRIWRALKAFEIERAPR